MQLLHRIRPLDVQAGDRVVSCAVRWGPLYLARRATAGKLTAGFCFCQVDDALDVGDIVQKVCAQLELPNPEEYSITRQITTGS